MTIKAIKEEYTKKESIKGLKGKKQFAVYNSKYFGKCIIVVINDHYLDKFVVGLIQVSTGKDILNDHSRPCDNMDDSFDVVSEMISDMFSNGELKDYE